MQRGGGIWPRIVAGAALAVIFWLRFPAFSEVEFGLAHNYVRIMTGIEQTGSFVRTLDRGGTIPEFIREPLYPYALVAADEWLGYYTRLIPFQEMALVATLLTWVFVIWNRLGWLWGLGFAALSYFNQPLFLYPAILYPYAFNVLFLSSALFFTLKLLETRRLRWAIFAGIAFGLTVHERGSLTPLPLFLAMCLACLPRLVSRRHVGALALVYAACVAPWLTRNALHGVIGMTGMNGQVLGYTYGNLITAEDGKVPPPPDPYGLRPRLVALIRAQGTDAGTWNFIFGEEESGRQTLAKVNRALTYYALQAIEAYPRTAAGIVWNNIATFPCRLVQTRVRSDGLWEYYAHNAWGRVPTLADWALVAFAVAGLAMMAYRREPVLAVMAPVLFVIFAIHVLVVVTDPRYRNGVFDFFIYYAALYALKAAGEHLIVRRHSKTPA